MDITLEASSRNRILDAALQLFATHGYAGASMRQIAAAVGMKAPSLYNHFSGKAAILSALSAGMGPLGFFWLVLAIAVPTAIAALFSLRSMAR